MAETRLLIAASAALCLSTVAVAQTLVRCVDPMVPMTAFADEWDGDPTRIAVWSDRASSAESTIVFMHISSTSRPSGPNVGKGAEVLYPFIATPSSSWTAGAVVAGTTTLELLNTPTSFALHIPPHRVRAHLLQLNVSGANFGEFTLPGSAHTVAGQSGERFGAPGSWPTSLSTSDERNSLQNREIQPGTFRWSVCSDNGDPVFDAVSAVRDSIWAAAHEWAGSAGGLDDQMIAELQNFLNSEGGFDIHLQAIHIKPDAAAGKIKIRVSAPAVVFRRSGAQPGNSSYFAQNGALRYLPNLFDNSYVYLAGLGEEAHILFPTAQSGLRAWFPTSTGGYVSAIQVGPSLQVTNPYHSGGAGGTYHAAVFTYPIDGGNGIAFFDDPNIIPLPGHSATQVIPSFSHGSSGGAMIVPSAIPLPPVQ